ncbi:MAG TPA: zinc ribbon domain-containing protein [Candidatus Dormibacteraeota bacterium]|nr:zinc ribbon domain-containing protein [Candidatus Dormibacteraeota bacterium]
MPIYEYKCPKCGVFEAMQRITEPSLKKCPTCKSKVERQMSRGSFVLKGSGWYATDYAKKATGTADSSESGATAANGNGSSSGDSSAKATSDSKPSSESKSSSSESKTSSDSKGSDSKGASASKSSSDKSASAKAAD